MSDMNSRSVRSLRPLLEPKAVAVVGASQRRGRGTSVVTNLRDAGFKGEIFAVNPRYEDVLGYKCFPDVASLPASVECLVIAVAADAACDVLEQAHARGIAAAIVLAAGFGEGGHGVTRAARLRALADAGMRICGPNCFGLINAKVGMAAYSGHLSLPLRPGPVAIVSQSGGLGANVFAPLMNDREIGFSYFVSSGNQIGATIEDYVEHFVHDPEVTVIAAVVEELKNPRKLVDVARAANERRKSLVLFQAGRSAAGRIMVQSHTGALAGNSEVLAAFLRRCGIVQVARYDEFVETVALFAVAPRDRGGGREIVVLSGSGGGAAVAADALNDAGAPVSMLSASTRERIAAVMPEFGSVNNPIDGTGAIYDDPTLLQKLFDAVLADPSRPTLAASLSAQAGGEIMRRFARTIADAARASDGTVVAYQYSPLGGPLDREIVRTLHGAQVPLLLGTSNAMGALKNLPIRGDFWARATAPNGADRTSHHTDPASARDPQGWDFLTARAALVASGVAIVDARMAYSEAEAVAHLRQFGTAVAVKAEAPGLLHKSDHGCVRLGCASEQDVREAYRAVIENARKAGVSKDVGALIQPMVGGVAEAYAGVIDDPTFGPAICFGLGGVFVEILKDTVIEMAPLTRDDALRMIRGIKAAPILNGARGRAPADTDALATLLVNLGQFACAHSGRFRALDLNPIIVGSSGAIAVDIAIEPIGHDAPGPATRHRSMSVTG
jgi:acyl-CoA synthetase (NDP forming)